VGGETLTRSFDVVRKGGLVLSMTSPPDEALARERGVGARFERDLTHAERLAGIASLTDAVWMLF